MSQQTCTILKVKGSSGIWKVMPNGNLDQLKGIKSTGHRQYVCKYKLYFLSFQNFLKRQFTVKAKIVKVCCRVYNTRRNSIGVGKGRYTILKVLTFYVN